MTLLVLVLGALGCVVLGVLIGYKFCAQVHGVEFQKMYDSGTIIIHTEDGRDGAPGTFESLINQYTLEMDND